MTKRGAVVDCIKEYLQVGGELTPMTKKWHEKWLEESLKKDLTHSEFHIIVSIKINSIYGDFPDSW